MEYYSAIKKNPFESVLMKWMSRRAKEKTNRKMIRMKVLIVLMIVLEKIVLAGARETQSFWTEFGRSGWRDLREWR